MPPGCYPASMSGPLQLSTVDELLLAVPADIKTSLPHAHLVRQLKFGKQWLRVREQLDADDIEQIGGLLRSFAPRGSRVLLGLLEGRSGAGAANAAGMTRQGVDHWRKSVPEFGAAFAMLAELGFSLVFETEIESRALAGDADRGSVRLLEMIAKSRGGDAYREKTEVTTRHLKGSEAATDVFDAMKLPDGSFGVKPTG